MLFGKRECHLFWDGESKYLLVYHDLDSLLSTVLPWWARIGSMFACLDLLPNHLENCAGKLCLARLREPNWLSWPAKVLVFHAGQARPDICWLGNLNATSPRGKLEILDRPSPIGQQSVLMEPVLVASWKTQVGQPAKSNRPTVLLNSAHQMILQVSVCQLKISGLLQARRELLCSVFSWNFLIHLQFFLVICFTFHLCSCWRYIIKHASSFCEKRTGGFFFLW